MGFLTMTVSEQDAVPCGVPLLRLGGEVPAPRVSVFYEELRQATEPKGASAMVAMTACHLLCSATGCRHHHKPYLYVKLRPARGDAAQCDPQREVRHSRHGMHLAALKQPYGRGAHLSADLCVPPCI